MLHHPAMLDTKHPLLDQAPHTLLHCGCGVLLPPLHEESVISPYELLFSKLSSKVFVPHRLLLAPREITGCFISLHICVLSVFHNIFSGQVLIHGIEDTLGPPFVVHVESQPPPRIRVRVRDHIVCQIIIRFW